MDSPRLLRLHRHVFAPETRVFYSLERLWGNAERIEVARAARRHIARGEP